MQRLVKNPIATRARLSPPQRKAHIGRIIV